MAAEQSLTVAEWMGLFFLTNIWFVISFYIHLPILRNPDKDHEDLHDAAALLALPTLILSGLKMFFTEVAYKGRREEDEEK